MGTLILKCTAILALVIAVTFEPTINRQLLLSVVVCMAGIAVTAQAMRAKQYAWAIAFFAIAVFFNPILTLQRAYSRHIGMSAACVAAFALSLFVLRNTPTNTIASIIDSTPEREAL